MSYGAWAKLCFVLVVTVLSLTTSGHAQTALVVDPRFIEVTFESHLSGPDVMPAPLWLGPGATPSQIPSPSEFEVLANGVAHPIRRVGAARRAVSAEKSTWKAAVQTRVILELAVELPPNAAVSIAGPGFTPVNGTFHPQRINPVIHLPSVGFPPTAVKRAFVARWLGDLGELPLTHLAGTPFKVIDSRSGTVVADGTLKLRRDTGFQAPAPVPQTLEADFSTVTASGLYQVEIPSLGRSPVFSIDPRVAVSAARTYALGLFHQRSGVALSWPETRFDRGAGHRAPVEIPDAHHPTNPLLAGSTADFANEARHTALQLSNVTASLYPFVRTGTADASGGHHDAGDYSKYTVNSAQLIHLLAFAARHVPGVGNLDNLGLPESGDGTGDVWQMALWEAEFLSKLQDLDGGFAFLVYPRERRYEHDRMPEHGDPQVFWPKNTLATASAVGALAEMAAAPYLREHFPETADRFLGQAIAGWNFLTNAIATHGKDGSYQKLTHYGTVFLHDDELCWAAAALFAATGHPSFETQLREWLPDPANRQIRRWSWWRLYGAYGNALRTFVFSATPTDPSYATTCRNEVRQAALDQAKRSEADAYALSFPAESKRFYSAGWFFASSQAFDIITGLQLNPTPDEAAALRSALWGCLGYEWGANPLNRTFVTGWGTQSPLHPVSQIDANDSHVLPPSGTLVGCLQTGTSWLSLYGSQLSRFTYPADGLTNELRYPLYDRHTDVFNTLTEATVVEQGAGIAVTAAVLAEQAIATDAGRATAAQILGIPVHWPVGTTATLRLDNSETDLTTASITWEWPDGWQSKSPTLEFRRESPAALSIDAEALLPDGRRVYARASIPSINRAPAIDLATPRLALVLPTCSTFIQATVDDDIWPSLPLRVLWTAQEGPGPVNFTDPLAPSTHVSVRIPGEYRLRLAASDGEFNTFAEVLLVVSGEAPSAVAADPPGVLARFDGDSLENRAPLGGRLTPSGNVAHGVGAGFWGPTGEGAYRFRRVDDALQIALPDLLEKTNTVRFGFQARVLVRGFKAYGVQDSAILSLRQDWDACLEIIDGKWTSTRTPFARAGKTTVLPANQWNLQVPADRWVLVRFTYETATSRAVLAIDDVPVAQASVALNPARTTPFQFSLGHFDGDLDEILVFRE